MKPIYILAAAVPLLAVGLSAQPQDDLALQKMKAEMESMLAQSKVVGLRGAVMGQTVKGAPYSATEVMESTQTLADGTRIHNENQTQVYRDSEGRVRRETPDQVTIMDPVAGTTFFLDPKTQTARKVTLGTAGSFTFATAKGAAVAGSAAGSSGNFVEVRSINKDGVTSVTVNGKPVDPSTIDHLKMTMAPPDMEPMMMDAAPVMRQRMPAGTMVTTSDNVFYKSTARPDSSNSESLGKQSIEGVLSDGTRSTTTLPAGAIGNDRPIQSVMERWYSAELQTVTMTRHSDPRIGESTFKLTNVNRNEPAAYLFTVPSSYQLQEHK